MNTGSGTTLAATRNGITANNLIVCVVGHGTAAATSVTISVSDGTSSLTMRPLNDQTGRHGRFGYLLQANGGNKTFTATFGSSVSFSYLSIYEFAYTGTASLDTDTNTAAGTTDPQPVSAAITTTGTDEVVVAYQMNDNGSPTTTATINGVAATGTFDDGALIHGDWYRILTATFASGTATCVYSAGAGINWICGVIAFKSTAGGPKSIVAGATSYSLTGGPSGTVWTPRPMYLIYTR